MVFAFLFIFFSNLSGNYCSLVFGIFHSSDRLLNFCDIFSSSVKTFSRHLHFWPFLIITSVHKIVVSLIISLYLITLSWSCSLAFLGQLSVFQNVLGFLVGMYLWVHWGWTLPLKKKKRFLFYKKNFFLFFLVFEINSFILFFLSSFPPFCLLCWVLHTDNQLFILLFVSEKKGLNESNFTSKHEKQFCSYLPSPTTKNKRCNKYWYPEVFICRKYLVSEKSTKSFPSCLIKAYIFFLFPIFSLEYFYKKKLVSIFFFNQETILKFSKIIYFIGKRNADLFICWCLLGLRRGHKKFKTVIILYDEAKREEVDSYKFSNTFKQRKTPAKY